MQKRDQIMPSQQPLPNFRRPVVDRSNVTVYLSGLSVTTLDPDQTWRTIFLENLGHNDNENPHLMAAAAWYESEGPDKAKSLKLAESYEGRRLISLDTADQTGSTGYWYAGTENGTDPRDSDHLGDFSSHELHGDDVVVSEPTGSKPALISMLSIPGGSAYTAAFAEYCPGYPDQYSFGNGRKRLLGRWAGFDLNCAEGSVLKVVSSNSTLASRIEESLTVRGGDRLFICFNNLCNGSEANDFHYYYRAHGGVIDAVPITLHHFKHPECTEGKELDRIINHRVACNAMFVKDPAQTAGTVALFGGADEQ
jgi:hypothetical protein